ncbi:MAG: oxidoreductase, partial [Candidatus Zixiibacteriota bacterium]
MKRIRLQIGYLILLLIAFSSCADSSERNQTEKLEPAEIEEYQGTKLSSVHDFRENSIQGPQYITQDSVRLKIT